jgi:phosphate transport system permease protein
MSSIQKSSESSTKVKRPLLLSLLGLFLGLTSVGVLIGGLVYVNMASPEAGFNGFQITVLALLAAGILAGLAFGVWNLKDWARLVLLFILVMCGVAFSTSVIFDVFKQIFSGESIVPISQILTISLNGLIQILWYGAIPIVLILILVKYSSYFYERPEQRALIDRSVRYILVITALSSVFIVFLIMFFTANESKLAVSEVGIFSMIFGTVWRPGSIIGNQSAQFGMLPMILGSFLSTLGAVVLGVPLSLGTAILLAEIAPIPVVKLMRPAVELLAGIPSVVYGLFGMVVLAPLIRQIQVSGNSGFNLLNASIILAVMIIPTVTNIAEDAINAVPQSYKEASLALGSTHWQTIASVLVPAARSGIVAAIILGIGRALGETMALIMVIGNAIAMPKPLNNNPLTTLLAPARTLTGNIAVEINYAAGDHRSALFFSGVLLFFMLLIVNSMARYLMRERLKT